MLRIGDPMGVIRKVNRICAIILRSKFVSIFYAIIGICGGRFQLGFDGV